MFAALFLFLLFFHFAESHVPMLHYWDELATFLVLCWGAYDFSRNRTLEKGEWVNWICLAALVVIGALGNLIHPGLQTAKVALVKDVMALIKFPVVLFVLQRRTVSEKKQEQIIACAAKISRWLIIVALFAAIIGYFVDLGFYDSMYRTKPAFKFVFSRHTFFVSAYVMAAAALMAESVNRNRIYLLVDCLLLLLALRAKANVFVAFAFLFVLLGEEWVGKLLTMLLGSNKQKVKPIRFILALVILCLMILLVARKRIEGTLNSGLTVPRTVLHVIGIRILMDFFPLGSGLGTFASYLSGRYYSNIYDMYGISNVIGMNREKYNFISDVFWPYIYGQFGVFGTLIYAKLIISLFFRQFHSAIKDNSRIAVAAVWIYALIASTSEAYFTNGTGVQMALFLGLFIGYGGQQAVSEREPIAENNGYMP